MEEFGSGSFVLGVVDLVGGRSIIVEDGLVRWFCVGADGFTV